MIVDNQKNQEKEKTRKNTGTSGMMWMRKLLKTEKISKNKWGWADPGKILKRRLNN